MPNPRVQWSPMTLHLAIPSLRPDHTQTPSPMEPHGVPFRYTRRTPRRVHLVAPNINPSQIQTSSPMEHDGGSFGHAKHTPTTLPDPEPNGASWASFWWHTRQNHNELNAAFGATFFGTQTTPRPQVLWSPMGFHLVIQITHPDHIQTPSAMGIIRLYKPYTQTTP